ncbi:MAG: YfbM family protein [Acidobacteriota bacterium]
MNGKLRRVPAQDWSRVRTDEQFRNGLLEAGWQPAVDMTAGLSILPWYARWPMRFLLRKQIKAMKAAQAPNQAKKDAGEVLDLHKSWHGLHWLMCQSVWEGPEPYRSAILGGEEIGDDLGYGPPRLVEPAKVEDVARALSMLSVSQLMKRYDGHLMERHDVYPGNFSADESWKSELRRDYERLQKFYKETAAEGGGMLSWID